MDLGTHRVYSQCPILRDDCLSVCLYLLTVCSLENPSYSCNSPRTLGCLNLKLLHLDPGGKPVSLAFPEDSRYSQHDLTICGRTPLNSCLCLDYSLDKLMNFPGLFSLYVTQLTKARLTSHQEGSYSMMITCMTCVMFSRSQAPTRNTLHIFSHLFSQQRRELGVDISPILETRKLRLRDPQLPGLGSLPQATGCMMGTSQSRLGLLLHTSAGLRWPPGRAHITV